MRVIQSKSLPTGITTSDCLSWSSDHKLAVLTNKGILVCEVVPNPSCTSPGLNLRQTLVPNDGEEDFNPYLEGAEKELRHLRGENSSQVEMATWAPPKAMLPNRDCLATLTNDHWMRIVGRRDGGDDKWETLFDVSRLLQQHLNSERKESSKKAIADEITLNLALTAFAWSDDYLLITGSKSGQLAIWISDEGELKLQCLHQTCLGEIHRLLWHRVGEQRFLLFVAGSDGRVQVLSVTLRGQEASVEESGFLWDIPDHAKIGHMSVVRDDYASKRTLRLALAKDCFVIFSDAEFSGEAAAVSVSNRWSKETGWARVIDVEPLHDDGSYVVVNESGQPNRLVDDRTDCRLEPMPVDLDTGNFKCLGLKRSRGGGAVFAMAQNVSAYHDHLVLRNPGKLVFLTPLSLDEMSEHLATFAGESLDAVSDHLEAYRALSMCSDEPQQLPHVVRTGGGRPDKRRLSIWMCRLFASLAAAGDSEEEVGQVLDSLCLEALRDHARKAISENKDKSSSVQCFQSLVSFSLKHETKANLKRDLLRRKVPAYDWRCRLCDGSVKEDCYDSVECSGGHVWPRCVLTLRVCDGPVLLHCPFCEAIALPDNGLSLPEICTYCGVALSKT